MEVHPPDHPVMTWKQFFVHMAVVVLGLLIAIGLEQAVEKLHEHHEVKEAYEAMRHEQERNIILARMDSVEARREMTLYTGDLQSLRLLRAHPGISLHDLPATLTWSNFSFTQETSAWTTLRSGPVALLIDPDQMRKWSVQYDVMKQLNDQGVVVWNDAVEASNYRYAGKSPTELTPEDLDRTIAATERLVGDAWKRAVYLENLCEGEASAGYSNCVSADELSQWERYVPMDQLEAVYGPAGQRLKEQSSAWEAQTAKLQHELDALGSKR